MGSTVLITGGSRGIGAAIAARIRADGYKVVVLDRIAPEHADLDDFLEVDMADVAQLSAVLAEVVRRHAPTGLVNNVGIVRPASLDDVTPADVDAVLALNVRAAVMTTQAVAASMRAAGHGRIVSISSRTALGKPLRTAYSASKAALHGLTRTWALELAADGITVNAVAPGTIGTPEFFRNNPPDDPRTRAIITAIPAGRIGTPDDIANAVAFFLDPRSSFVNGQVLYVCGGLTVGLSG